MIQFFTKLKTEYYIDKMIEIDNKLRKTLKKRNVSKMKTQKLIENFQDNPTKYLKFKELQNQGSQNYNWLFKKIKDALVQSPIFNSLDSHTQDSIYKANNLTRRAYNQDSYQKYFSHLSNTECKNCGSILNYDNDIMLLKSCGKSYDNYYLAKYNDVFKILDVDRLSKGFQYFELTDIAYSPDNGYLSFCIDFIGNKNYIFFTQNIYTRKITIHNLSKGNNEKFLNRQVGRLRSAQQDGGSERRPGESGAVRLQPARGRRRLAAHVQAPAPGAPGAPLPRGSRRDPPQLNLILMGVWKSRWRRQGY